MDREPMDFHPDDLYQDRTWFDALGAWLAQCARRWRPRQPARLWSLGFALFAALCVAWAAALATQCVLADLPRNMCIAQWLAAALLLVAARHFLAVTGLCAASAIDERQRIKRTVTREWSAEASDAISIGAANTPDADPAKAPAQNLGEDPQRFFRAVKAAGINLRIAHALYAAGFRTAEQVRTAEDKALLAAPGIGPATLRKLRAQFGSPDTRHNRHVGETHGGAQSRAA